jgi:hypothetical protein
MTMQMTAGEVIEQDISKLARHSLLQCAIFRAFGPAAVDKQASPPNISGSRQAMI